MEKPEAISTILLMIVILMTVIGIIMVSYKPVTPTALDVYRGKTTLQITYKDSIPIDSVVVFK